MTGTMTQTHFHLPKQYKFQVAIVSQCHDDWGGSEELWALSIPYLQAAGAEISLIKNYINPEHHRIAELAAKGVKLYALKKATLKERIIKRVKGGLINTQKINWDDIAFKKRLLSIKPNLVIIAQAINFDGLEFAAICLELKIPYVVICQKAVEFFWPPVHLRERMKQALETARKCYFVSQHNRQLTEEQFGSRLTNAAVIHNPIRFKSKLTPYPGQNGKIKLACIGRLFVIDKGQDILLRILSNEKWRSRPLEVSFFGAGPDEAGLKEMARLLQVDNIKFAGHTNNIEHVWETHHALVLPSRSEGMPLVVLEALAMGRPVISTRAGGTPEYVEENISGFLSEPTVADFDAALERAWQQQHRWKEMGANALKTINQKVSGCPEMDFANEIITLLYEN